MSGSPQTNTINTILNKLSSSKFTGSPIFTSLAQVDKALSGQDKHLTEIKELRAKINIQSNSQEFTNIAVAQDIINKYLNFIDYIIALIEAKIKKDQAMTTLLTKTFEGVNSFIRILDESKDKLTSKNRTKTILQNIGITDNDLKFKISNLGLKKEEIPEGISDENGMIGRDSIAQLVTKIIENCQTRLTTSIDTFTESLNKIIPKGNNQGGGDLNNNVYKVMNSRYNVEAYKQQFRNIKNNYEQGLKDNIIAYREICEILLSKETDSPGIVKIIIDSVNGLNLVNKEITKKFGFKLGIFHDENPFAENKTAFNALKNEIINAKNGLSVSPSRIISEDEGNDSDDSSDSEATSDSDESTDSGESTDSNYPELVTRALLPQTFIDNPEIEDFARKIGGMTRGDWINKKSQYPDDIDPLIRSMGLSPRYNLDNDVNFNIEQFNNKVITIMRNELNRERGSSLGQAQSDNYQDTKRKWSNILPSGYQNGGYKKKSKSKKMTSKKTSMKVAKKTSSKEKAKENKNKKIVKSYSKSKSKKQSGGFIRGGVLFPQDFYDTSTVM